MKRSLATALIASAAALVLATGASAQSNAAGHRVDVKTWDVYVDLPTGFAFVNTPLGWRFVRQLDDGQMARLPASTLVSLLPESDAALRYAHPAMEPSPRQLALQAQAERVAMLSRGAGARP